MAYNKSPINLYYLDETNNEFLIESDQTLTEIVKKAADERKMESREGPISINLVVVSPIKRGLRFYKSSAIS